MTKTMETLKNNALLARTMLANGAITYAQALETVERYVDAANAKGVVMAKKYGVKYHNIDPKGFLR